MTETIKKSSTSHLTELIQAIPEFCTLLEGEKGEGEAIAELKSICIDLQADEADLQSQLKRLFDAFEGDHELVAYTLYKSKGDGEWTRADHLLNLSSRVLNLANRLKDK